MIFRINWMTRNRTLIDYRKKKVQLRLKRNVRITFQGRGRDRDRSLISYTKAHRLIDQGCQGSGGRAVCSFRLDADQNGPQDRGTAASADGACPDDNPVHAKDIPRIGPPLPSALIGSPLVN